MKKLLGGGVACALALVGSAVFTQPGGAQTAELQAEIDPTAVEPGEAAYLQSVDPCLDPADGEGAGRVAALLHFPDGTTVDLDDLGGVQADEAGNWSTSGALTSTAPLGEYTFEVTCLPPEADTPVLAYNLVSFTLEVANPMVEGLSMTTSPALPGELAPGTHVDVTSSDPCPGHRSGRAAVWEVWSVDFDAGVLKDRFAGGEATVTGDGSWTASFTASTVEDGYGLFAFCVRSDFEAEEGWTPTGMYEPLGFIVNGPDGGEPPDPGPVPELPGPTQEPGAPAPARPVTARPNATG